MVFIILSPLLPAVLLKSSQTKENMNYGEQTKPDVWKQVDRLPITGQLCLPSVCSICHIDEMMSRWNIICAKKGCTHRVDPVKVIQEALCLVFVFNKIIMQYHTIIWYQNGRRDAVLLSLLYDTGARVQELADLKVCDINLNDTVTIVLTGKGSKSRIVPVMKPTGELLRQYIEGNGLSHPARSRNPLFTNRGNHPLTRAGVTYILKKYAAQAQTIGVKDISEEITPHWLRHSKAMHLLQSGVNLIYIRDLLGHSDVSTTEIYVRADETMKRKALLEAYESPSEEQLPTWKKDKDLLDWLKSL